MKSLRAAPALAGIVLLAALAASCGRPPRPGRLLDGAEVRYAEAREHREALLAALTGEWTVRAEGRGIGHLPTLPVAIDLAAPDRARMRVSAIVGVALDVLVTRDSLMAWVPSQRLAFAAPGESLGFLSPAEWAGRVLGATWAPPPEAWRAASADSDGWSIAWREGPDTLVLRVDRDGRPSEQRVARAGRGLTVRWSRWAPVRGEPFPERVEVADDSATVRVRMDALDVHAENRASDGWFTPRRATGWRTMTWDDLREVLERRGLP